MDFDLKEMAAFAIAAAIGVIIAGYTMNALSDRVPFLGDASEGFQGI